MDGFGINRSDSLKDVVDFFNKIGTDPPRVKSMLPAVFKVFNKKQQDPASLDELIAGNISSVIKILDKEPSSKRVNEVAAVIEAVSGAIYRLEEKPDLTEDMLLILKRMKDASVYLSDYKNLSDPEERRKEKINAFLDQLTEYFGLSNYEHMKPAIAFLDLEGGRQFFEQLFSDFVKFRQDNLNCIEQGKLWGVDANEQWMSKVMSDLNTVASGHDEILRFMLPLVLGILGGAVPLNTQINTDGFTIGLFDRHVAHEKTLSFEDATTERALKKNVDAAGYSFRSPFVKNRVIWKDVDPEDILAGEKPFLKGIREFHFKLSDGSRRSAQVELDLSPLGEMTFEQNRKVLLFVCKMGLIPDKNLFSFAEKRENGNPIVEELTDDVKNITEELHFTEKQIQTLVDISIKFNIDVTRKMHKALFSLTPDIKASCEHELKNLLKEGWEWSEPVLQRCLDDPEVLKHLKVVLDQYDVVVFLRASDQKQTPEGEEKIRLAQEKLLELSKGFFDAVIANGQIDVNIVIPIFTPLLLM